MATIDDFTKLDIRIGTIVEAEPFPEARVPAIKMKIDFGPLGIKRTSAQITNRYDAGTIIGNQVVAIVNFPPRRIAGYQSEVLVLGGYRSRETSCFSSRMSNCRMALPSLKSISSVGPVACSLDRLDEPHLAASLQQFSGSFRNFLNTDFDEFLLHLRYAQSYHGFVLKLRQEHAAGILSIYVLILKIVNQLICF